MTAKIDDFLAKHAALLSDDLTPGPWREDDYSNGIVTGCGQFDMHGDPLTVAETVYRTADREFICAARDDMPKLMAALEAVVDLAETAARVQHAPLASRMHSGDPFPAVVGAGDLIRAVADALGVES